MTEVRLLAFSGSSRAASWNHRLVSLGATFARQAGAEVTLVNLRDFSLPLYDGDLEADEGMPSGARELRELMIDHDGLLIASPEYNSSLTPLLKNAIDWSSRADGDQPGLAPYHNKIAALLSASTGNLGGLRGLVHLRQILGNMGVLVIPEQLAVPKAAEAFDANGSFTDATHDAAVQRLVTKLIRVITRLKDSQ